MLEKGDTLSADGRQYTVIEQLGRGANTVAYLAECSHGELVTKCILPAAMKRALPTSKSSVLWGEYSFRMHFVTSSP